MLSQPHLYTTTNSSVTPANNDTDNFELLFIGCVKRFTTKAGLATHVFGVVTKSSCTKQMVKLIITNNK